MEIQSDAGAAQAPTGAPVLNAVEAERLVESLERFKVEQVGSPAWIRQHGVIEKLNLQAHYNASTNSDPFVLEALITFDKLRTLLHELVVTEAWREFMFPRVKDRVAQKHSMRVYYVLYHEAVLLNLFEVLLYHQHCAEALEEEMIELVDVCARKMTLLNARDPKVTPAVFDSAKERFEAEDKQSTAQQLESHLCNLGFRACVSAVTVARYIAEHIKHLPVSVMSRVLDNHDFMIQFVALLENPPWVRRTNEGTWQKFYDLKWHDVPPRDLLMVTRNEGQVWIGLYNLMCEPDCQKRYHFNSHRKDAVLRVRKYLNEVLVDQIPVLQHVQRYMDELAIMQAPEPTAMKSLVVEQVPHMREGVARETDWPDAAERQLASLFGEEANPGNEDLVSLAELYTSAAYEGAE